MFPVVERITPPLTTDTILPSRMSPLSKAALRINNPADVLEVGQVVDVKITEIDDENRKLALSIRALVEEKEKAERAAAEAEERAQAEAEAAAEAERIAQERADMAPYIVGSID